MQKEKHTPWLTYFIEALYRQEVRKQIDYIKIAKEELEKADVKVDDFKSINQIHRVTIRYVQTKIALCVALGSLMAWVITYFFITH